MLRMATSIRTFFVLLAGAAAPNVAATQVIAPRTVPVLIGQQFDILPSDRAGMAGVTIALDDTLIDAFVNPAKASRVRNAFFTIAPFFYSTSNSNGGARTFPVSGVGRFGRSSWSGAGLFALQQLDRSVIAFDQPLSERTAANQYVMGILSRRVGEVSIGASAYFADLGAEEGIDLLYSGSDRIQQAGRAADVRVGMTKDWAGHRSFEALIVRSQFDMTHDVHYPAITRWVGQSPQQVVVEPERQEHNRDHTTTWGAHSEYSQAIGTEGWRVGWLATANRLSHPKIPDYRIREVITVPRDPGHTSAYNFGFGLAKLTRYSSFGMDVILEPIYSTTWAEALGDTLTASGAALKRGAHSVDNRLRFSNALLRFGIGHELPIGKDSTEHFGFQFGLGVQSTRYRLNQSDRIAETARTQNEHWMEWSPTFGFKYRGRGFDAGYTFTLTCGAGSACMPSCFIGCGDDVSVTAPEVPGGGGVIASPTDALRFEGGRVSTHRFTVTMRVR